jgi:hypothetical protein
MRLEMQHPEVADPPDARKVWAVAAGVAVLAGLLGALFDYNVPTTGTDFNWSVRAARDLLAGQDPYARPFGPNAFPIRCRLRCSHCRLQVCPISSRAPCSPVSRVERWPLP